MFLIFLERYTMDEKLKQRLHNGEKITNRQEVNEIIKTKEEGYTWRDEKSQSKVTLNVGVCVCEVGTNLWKYPFYKVKIEGLGSCDLDPSWHCLFRINMKIESWKV